MILKSERKPCCGGETLLWWVAEASSNSDTMCSELTIQKAPITEELVFRACMVPIFLAGGFGETATIFLVPLFFGIGKPSPRVPPQPNESEKPLYRHSPHSPWIRDIPSSGESAASFYASIYIVRCVDVGNEVLMAPDIREFSLPILLYHIVRMVCHLPFSQNR